jgi:hypothetical protein
MRTVYHYPYKGMEGMVDPLPMLARHHGTARTADEEAQRG